MNKQAKYDVIVCLSFFIIYLSIFIGITFLMVFIDSSVTNNIGRIVLIVNLSIINLGNIVVGAFMLLISIKTLVTKREVNISITGEDDGVSSKANSISN